MAPDHPGATAEVDEPAAAGASATAPTAEDDPTIATARVGGVEDGSIPPAPWSADDSAGLATESDADGGPTDGAAATDPGASPQMRKVRRGRRVKRVIRRIELWSVLKLALVFYTCMYVVVMGTLVIVWGFAYSAGLVDNFESFANDVGFEHWQFYGEHMFRQAAVIGGVMVVAATVLTVLATALVNVISELTGGIRVVVIEEDIIEVPIGDDGRARGRSGPLGPAPRGRTGPGPTTRPEPEPPFLTTAPLRYRRRVPGL